VKWIVRRLRLFDIVDDLEFRELMLTGQPSYWILSCWTVQHDVSAFFEKVRLEVIEFLAVSLRTTTVEP
jgi:hypothetical protein